MLQIEIITEEKQGEDWVETEVEIIKARTFISLEKRANAKVKQLQKWHENNPLSDMDKIKIYKCDV